MSQTLLQKTELLLFCLKRSRLKRLFCRLDRPFCRKDEEETGTTLVAIVKINLAIELIGNGATHIEAQAYALLELVGLDEALEDIFRHLRRHTASRVSHRETQRAQIGKKGEG